MTAGRITFGPPSTHVAQGYQVDTGGNIRPMLPCPDDAARKHVEGVRVPRSATLSAAVHQELEPWRLALRTPVTVGAGTAANDNLEALVADTNERFPNIMGALHVSEKLDTLPRGIVYVGSPYTLYPHGLHRAAREAAMAAARLMEVGLVVYAPIPHGHNIACWGDLPASWEFWKGQCQPYIDAASSLVVLKLEGWQDSVGLTYEIEEFERQGKPVVMVTMDEVLALREARGEKRMAA